MPYVTPKTDWNTNPKSPLPEDFNRIEGNIAFLNADIETKKGLIVQALNEMNQSATLNDLYATLYNKIKAISTDADAAVGDVLSPKTFYQGGAKKAGAMPSKVGSGTILTPGNADIVIPQGYFGGAATDGKVAAVVVPTDRVLLGTTIAGQAGTAKRQARGTANNTDYGATITIGGLEFVPTRIMLSGFAFRMPYGYTYVYNHPYFNASNCYQITTNYEGGGAGYSIGPSLNLSINGGSFSWTSPWANDCSWTWEAYE